MLQAEPGDILTQCGPEKQQGTETAPNQAAPEQLSGCDGYAMNTSGRRVCGRIEIGRP